MSALATRLRSIDPWMVTKLAAAAAAAVCLATGAPRIGMALALHGLMDFSLQPARMCEAKARGDRVALALHALMAGGIPGWVAGGWIGVLVGVATHGTIDSARKFGVRGMAGLALDQALHVAVIAVIVAIGATT